MLPCQSKGMGPRVYGVVSRKRESRRAVVRWGLGDAALYGARCNNVSCDTVSTVVRPEREFCGAQAHGATKHGATRGKSAIDVPLARGKSAIDVLYAKAPQQATASP